MKWPVLLLCFLYLYSTSQSLQKVQLKTVIAEAPNDFQKYKGELKTALPEDSTYTSIIVIDGSKDNEIGLLPGNLVQYYAYIADSADKKKAKALTELWKDRVAAAAPDYTKEQIGKSQQKRKTTGYRFTKMIDKALYYISVVYSKREIDDFYWVLLTISRQLKNAMENAPY